jgi:tetratricopeptide (TPR) repeat protein
MIYLRYGVLALFLGTSVGVASSKELTEAQMHYLRGYWKQQNGDRAGAEECYRKAAELDPTDFYTFLNLGALLSAAKGREAEAEPFLRKAILLKPSDPSAYYNLANALRRSGNRVSEAESLYRKALELSPEEDEYWIGLGLLYYQAEVWKRAEDAFRKAVASNDSSASARYNLAITLSKSPEGEDEALTILRRLQIQSPRDADTYEAIGEILSKRPGEIVEAERMLRKAIELQPEYAEAHKALGDLLAKLPKREREARAAWERALEVCRRLSQTNMIAEIEHSLKETR